MNDWYKIIYGAFLIICLILAITYLWPLFLVVGLMIWWQVHKVRKAYKQAQEEAFKEYDGINETYGTSFQDDLFRSSMDQTNNKQAEEVKSHEVFDAEYSEHEDGE